MRRIQRMDSIFNVGRMWTNRPILPDNRFISMTDRHESGEGGFVPSPRFSDLQVTDHAFLLTPSMPYLPRGIVRYCPPGQALRVACGLVGASEAAAKVRAPIHAGKG